MVRQGKAAQMFPCDACAIVRGGAGAVSHIQRAASSVEGGRARREAA